MKSTPLRAGIVGLMYGRYGILPALQANPAVRVVALCSRNREFAQATAQAHGVPHTYTNWQAMLEEAELDLLAVAVDPPTSGPICAQAIEHGIALFAEKLPSHDIEQTRQLARQAQAKGLATCVDYMFPQLATFSAAKRMLQAGEIGKLRLVTLDWVMQSYDHQHSIDSWKVDSQRGGGVLRHFLIHSMHYLEWFCGRMVSIRAILKPLQPAGRSDAFAALSIECSSGSLVTINASNAAPGETRHALTLWGDKGRLELHNTGRDPIRGFTLAARRYNLPNLLLRELDFSKIPLDLDSRIEPTGRLTDALVARLAGQEHTEMPDLRAALRAHELIEAASLSNQANRVVYVN